MIFREARKEDAASIAELHAESWRNAYRGILPDAYLDGPIIKDRISVWQERLASSQPERQFILLAIAGDLLQGFVCVLLDEEPQRGACLDNLHVHHDRKRQGLGRQLFARAAQWVATTEPAWPLHLWVFEHNNGAREFYDSLGGAIVEHSNKHIAGVDVPSVCYLWNDLTTIHKLTINNWV